MSKNIIVAGAGHGGIVAGYYLAQNGYNVTVYEKGKKNRLGYPQVDAIHLDGFEEAGIPVPEDYKVKRTPIAFCVLGTDLPPLVQGDSGDTYNVEIDRKALYKYLIGMAEEAGVKFVYDCEIVAPIVLGSRVAGIKTSKGDFYADLVIDAAGVFSPVRMGLPEEYGIEKEPKYGDLFYACRAYYDRLPGHPDPEAPFEVYLYHEGERGLSWFCTNEDSCDVLIGRTDPLTEEKIAEQLAIFRESHPWLGQTVLHGGQMGVIPVRRPLTLLVGDGYAAVGDSAFMTTPMNGMGIDLSLQAGRLLAETVAAKRETDFSAADLWDYNRAFHRLYGGDAAKNEGLKNALLSLPPGGVDFLFEAEVIQSSDLAGAGKNTKLSALLGKFARGMKQPASFFTILGGLIKGAKAAKLYQNAPARFDREAIRRWSEKIAALDVRLAP